MDLPWIWAKPSWPHFAYDAAAAAPDLAEAHVMHGVVSGKAAAICLEPTSQVALDVLSSEVMSTAAIEGEHLNAASVRSSVLRRLGVADEGRPDRHVEGLVEVISDAMTNYDSPLDEDRLCRWQSALFPGGTSGLRRIAVGRYRDHDDPMQIVSGRLGREKVHYEAPPSKAVPQEMQRFLAWFNDTAPTPGRSSTGPRIDGLARAAIAHVWFESIHPFEDGNGRLGRAIIDMAMMQHLRQPVRLISLSRQLEAHRGEYYDALNREQRGEGDVTQWVQWFAKQCAAAYRSTEHIIDSALEKRRFWDVHAGAVNTRQQKVLQRLLDDGNGGFLGGMSADKYMKMTGVSKATATRDLTEMAEKGQLWTQGVGKGIRYYVNVPGWTHGFDRDAADKESAELTAANLPQEEAELQDLRTKLTEAGYTVAPLSGERDRLYIGPVIAVSDGYVAQDLGRRQAVIHDLRALDRRPSMAERLEISFKGGRGETLGVAPAVKGLER